MTKTPFSFVGNYSMESLIERAVRNARPHCYGKLPRWVGVRDTFCYGSTTSAQLCAHFGLDPWEEVEGCYPNEESEEELPTLSCGHQGLPSMHLNDDNEVQCVQCARRAGDRS